MTTAHRALCRPKNLSTGPSGSLPAGAIFHYDASAITGLADAAGLATWNDLTANAYNLAAATGTHGGVASWHQPTYYKTSVTINGLAVVKFDGTTSSGCAMTSPAFTMAEPWTIFFVHQGIGLTNTSHTIFYDDQSTSGSANGGAYNGQWYEYAGTVLGVGTVDNSPHVITMLPNGASSRMYQDATEATGTIGGTTGFSGGLTLGSQTINAPSITLFASGYFGEIVCYASQLTDAQIAQAQSYLKSKWGTP